MNTLAADQAESLRRMLAPRAMRRIAVVASWHGAGATTVALGLANALAMQGERVILVDEDQRAARATKLAGAVPRGTLANVLDGVVTLDTAIGERAGSAPAVLSGAATAWGDLDALKPYRTAVWDTQIGSDGQLSQLARGAHNLVVVMRPDAASIKAAYGCIKHLHHQYACRQFRLVVNGAASEAAVSALTANLARTASQYLGVEATCAGVVPHDPLIERAALLGRCVVDAYPGAPATAALRRIAGGIAAWPLKTDEGVRRAALAPTPVAATAQVGAATAIAC